MIRKKFNKLNNYVYEEVLENGLRIYICKIKRKNIFAEMTVLYGSKDTEFKKEEDKNFIKTYTGTAHFLEHLIYTKDGDFDPAEIYNKNSASHNAYTNKTVTAYHFYGPRNFEENLNTLLKCVTTLNITKKDVDKERNIIRQELLKYEDNPGFISDTKCLENTIIEDSYRYDTGGKVSDLDKIDLRGKKILIAEDNELNMEISTEILEMQGVILTKARNGQEAVDIFKQSKEGTFDAILMDMQMPVLNGCDATRQIRQLPRKDAKIIPILAVTANTFAEDIVNTQKAGMNDHIAKPIDFAEIQRVLSQYLNK